MGSGGLVGDWPGGAGDAQIAMPNERASVAVALDAEQRAPLSAPEPISHNSCEARYRRHARVGPSIRALIGGAALQRRLAYRRRHD